MSTSDPVTSVPAGGNGHYSGSSDSSVWFRAHFEQAVDEVIDFFGGDGISLAGKRVADVGCGDGITDLGLALKAGPRSLVGFDVVPTDAEVLRAQAADHGVGELPGNLSFVTSGETELPAKDRSFDYVISWSAFEHILDPVSVLREMRRILTDDGVLFIQVWPFYDSPHGTHLVDWFPDGYAQYRHDDAEILRRMQSDGSDPERVRQMYDAYRTLNRITADGLHAALREAGFRVVKLQLQADAAHIPAQAADLPPSRVGISGIKLLAIKDTGGIGQPTAPAAGSTTDRTPDPAGMARVRRTGVRLARSGLRRLDRRLQRLAD